MRSLSNDRMFCEHGYRWSEFCPLGCPDVDDDGKIVPHEHRAADTRRTLDEFGARTVETCGCGARRVSEFFHSDVSHGCRVGTWEHSDATREG